MKESEEIRAMRKYMARVSMSTSALRAGRYAKPGVKEKLRYYFSENDVLTSFSNPGRFGQELDKLTDQMTRLLPRGHLPWGRARKLANIFLRDTSYNFYLRKAYHLEAIESQLEVPIDTLAAIHLKGEPEGSDLGKWTGVKGITPESNRDFQNVALAVSKRLGIHRHLIDVIAWGVR